LGFFKLWDKGAEYFGRREGVRGSSLKGRAGGLNFKPKFGEGVGKGGYSTFLEGG